MLSDRGTMLAHPSSFFLAFSSPSRKSVQQRRPLHVSCSAGSKQGRYTLPPVYLSRSDLAWGSPPWRFEQTCFAEDLELGRAIPALSGAARTQDVVVVFAVDSLSRSSPGLWVKGNVRAALQLQCEWCNEGYAQEVQVPFSVWLNGEAAHDAEITSAEELAFPESLDMCDLSPAVVDAICLALPSLCLCGGKRCKKLGSQPSVVLASSPQQAAGGGTAAGSPFASLLRATKGGKGKGAGKSKKAGQKQQL